MKELAPSNIKNRFDVYRYFNGVAIEAKENLDMRHLRTPLVKTFLLEHVSHRGNGRPKSPVKIFEELGSEIKMIDDNFIELRFASMDQEGQNKSFITTGFLEQYDERFFAYYTCEESVAAKNRVKNWILGPDLDYAWFSSPLLQKLWDQDISLRGDQRFCKLIFKHSSIFEMPEDILSTEEFSEDCIDLLEDEEGLTDEDRPEVEKRDARFEMGDKIGRIKQALSKLQDNYNPLNSLYALRLPSRSARGGHILYQNGQITNRSDSFEDHRNTVRYLYRIYKSILEFTEKSAWHEITKSHNLHIGMKGVPLIIKFIDDPLNEATFNRWIQLAFQKRNQFKLWGDPIRLGPTKVHVYGADRHLWQPINLELTNKGLLAILPQGTCGNTFHRLITNIQLYVCPKIQAWIGSKPFEVVVQEWPPNKEDSDAN